LNLFIEIHLLMEISCVNVTELLLNLLVFIQTCEMPDDGRRFLPAQEISGTVFKADF